VLGLRRDSEYGDRSNGWLEAPHVAYGDEGVNCSGGLPHVADEGGRQQVRASKRKEIVRQGSFNDDPISPDSYPVGWRQVQPLTRADAKGRIPRIQVTDRIRAVLVECVAIGQHLLPRRLLPVL